MKLHHRSIIFWSSRHRANKLTIADSVKIVSVLEDSKTEWFLASAHYPFLETALEEQLEIILRGKCDI